MSTETAFYSFVASDIKSAFSRTKPVLFLQGKTHNLNEKLEGMLIYETL